MLHKEGNVLRSFDVNPSAKRGLLVGAGYRSSRGNENTTRFRSDEQARAIHLRGAENCI